MFRDKLYNILSLIDKTEGKDILADSVEKRLEASFNLYNDALEHASDRLAAKNTTTIIRKLSKEEI